MNVSCDLRTTRVEAYPLATSMGDNSTLALPLVLGMEVVILR